MTIYYDTKHNTRQRAAENLANDFKHNAIETAQETFYKKRGALVDAMPDYDGLRSYLAETRDAVSRNLDFYVKQFAENAERHGIHMHYAPTDVDALWEILDVFEQHAAKKAVKSKSMMTEEMGLNAVLEEAGVRVIETDCAENILQTAGDMPSHIVVPALHHTREDIAELYRKEGYDGDTVPENITHFLRRHLRQEFLTADVGIRGCNFAVAETGSVTLVTNEGNGRMVDTFPKVQVVVIGIDRILPTLESLDVAMALLPTSAVGAKMTAYFSLDTGVRREGELDGAEEIHYVLMDNGRHRLLGTEFEPMLRCIRCGACLNICPVYRHITGHGYGSIYPGPMGVVLTTAMEGYDKVGDLVYACTLCSGCAQHCPSKVPLHELIRKHRINKVDGGHAHKAEEPLFKAASLMWQDTPRYEAMMQAARVGMKALALGGDALDERSTWVPILKSWTRYRDVDMLAPKRFRTWFKEHKQAQAAAAKDGANPEGGDAR